MAQEGMSDELKKNKKVQGDIVSLHLGVIEIVCNEMPIV